MIDELTMPGGWRDGFFYFANQLLVGLVHAEERKAGVVGQVIDIQDVFHANHESGAVIGRNLPVFA